MEADLYILFAQGFRALAVLLVLALLAVPAVNILAGRRTGAPVATPTCFGGLMAAAVGPGNDVSRGLQSKDGRSLRASADSSAGAKIYGVLDAGIPTPPLP